ncbi:MAG: hypothetical protein Q7T82_10365, partial [Armatimonadota bacterium]|nr:hypothetical protein [Armatimonadota bacterium]
THSPHGRFNTNITACFGPLADCRMSNYNPATFRPVCEPDFAWRTETTVAITAIRMSWEVIR